MFYQGCYWERMEIMDQPFATTPRKSSPANRLPFSERVLSSGKDILSLTKPGINLSNLFACLAGYWLASGGVPEWRSLSWALLGTALVVGGSCALNNGIDRDFDRKMERTKHRPVPSGRIDWRAAVLLGLILTGAGVWLLFLGVNPLAAGLAAAGSFLYVVIYTLWLKRSSASNTVIGGLSGAIPPLIGWAAAGQGLTWTAWILFFILFLWQPPHFFALALLKTDDYRRAGIPMLPVVKGERSTRRQMLFFVCLLLPVSLLLVGTGAVSWGYSVAAWVLGVSYLILALLRFKEDGEKRWARWMFRYSLIYLTLILTAIAIFADPFPQ